MVAVNDIGRPHRYAGRIIHIAQHGGLTCGRSLVYEHSHGREPQGRRKALLTHNGNQSFRGSHVSQQVLIIPLRHQTTPTIVPVGGIQRTMVQIIDDLIQDLPLRRHSPQDERQPNKDFKDGFPHVIKSRFMGKNKFFPAYYQTFASKIEGLRTNRRVRTAR